MDWGTTKPRQGDVLEECRLRRYALLQRECAARDVDVLALGHHLEDQAETLLMRLSRRSNLRGLSCMRRIAEYGTSPPTLVLWRPCLDINKVRVQKYDKTLFKNKFQPAPIARQSELRQVCIDNALRWVEDPTNANEQYRRVRARRLLARLSERGCATHRLAALSDHCAMIDDALGASATSSLRCIARDARLRAPIDGDADDGDANGATSSRSSTAPMLVDADALLQLPPSVARRTLLALYARARDMTTTTTTTTTTTALPPNARELAHAMHTLRSNVRSAAETGGALRKTRGAPLSVFRLPSLPFEFVCRPE